MKIIILGATGYVGSAILHEALERGHDVHAVARDLSKLPSHARLSASATDAYDVASLTALVRGADVVISAFSPGHANPNLRADHGRGAKAIIEAAKRAHVRLLVVGGAGSLMVPGGAELVDTPAFPAQYKQTAHATRDFLALLRAEPELHWAFLSPAAELVPGERTGKYRVGGDALLVDATGRSVIHVTDYAVAMIDEAEKPAHDRVRFSVAY